METKYFSFSGRRLKLYQLNGDFYAIDVDIAAFFQVPKKQLLLTATRSRAEFTPGDKITLTKTERALFKIPPAGKVIAFNMTGLMHLAFKLHKNDIANAVSVEVIRETSKVFGQMKRTLSIANKIEDIKKSCTKLLIEMEIMQSRVHTDDRDAFMRYKETISETLSQACENSAAIKGDVEKVKGLLKTMPSAFSTIFFNQQGKQNYKNERTS
jgi:hypothetical protein